VGESTPPFSRAPLVLQDPGHDQVVEAASEEPRVSNLALPHEPTRFPCGKGCGAGGEDPGLNAVEVQLVKGDAEDRSHHRRTHPSSPYTGIDHAADNVRASLCWVDLGQLQVSDGSTSLVTGGERKATGRRRPGEVLLELLGVQREAEAGPGPGEQLFS